MAINIVIHPSSIINKGVTYGHPIEIMESCVIGTQPVSYKVVNKYPIRWERRIAEQGVKIGKNVKIHSGTNIMSGLERATEIRDRVILGQMVNVGHDVIIGKGTRIMLGVILLGFVEIKEGSYIGSGANIKQHVTIGSNVVVGMDATVVKDVPNNCIVVNADKDDNPIYAKVIRKNRSFMKAYVRSLLFRI